MKKERPDEVMLYTGVEKQGFLFFKFDKLKHEILPAKEAFAKFKESFLAFPHKMVVIHPSFTAFNPKYEQGFGYCPKARYFNLSEKSKYSDDTVKSEKAFFLECLNRITEEHAGQGEKPEVAYVQGEGLTGDGRKFWAKSFKEMLEDVIIISKETALKKIEMGLHDKIYVNDNNDLINYLMVPHESEGIFNLHSI